MTDSDREYDVFLCHASEDKDVVARPLALALSAAGLRVWYDESTLVVGSNLRRAIDYGLRSAAFGVIVLSPSFFAKQWPQWELDGLVQLALENKNALLPIWHGVSLSDVNRHSPPLANLVAVSTARGLGNVIQSILVACRQLRPQIASEPSWTPQSAHRERVDRERFIVLTPGDQTASVGERIPRFPADIESLIVANDDVALHRLIMSHPWFVANLTRSHVPVLLCLNPSREALNTCDAVAISIPQYVQVSFLRLGPVSVRPFQERGSWSSELADLVGAMSALTSGASSANTEVSRALMEIVEDNQRRWPYASGRAAFGRLESAVKEASHVCEGLLLLGRHHQVDERARRALYDGMQRRVMLRSYDSLLYELYHWGHELRLETPMILASAEVSQHLEGALEINAIPIETLRTVLAKQLNASASEFEILLVHLSAWIGTEQNPDGLEKPPEGIANRKMPIAIGCKVNDSPSQGDSWTTARIWRHTFSPLEFLSGAVVLFKVGGVEDGVLGVTRLHVGISSLTYIRSVPEKTTQTR
jgi:hypothetical protein